ncbi:MAG: hypothetical protein ACD_79C00370G0001 [uncultured bacterium]|nr:MAG: hypothetical protein ACD_79C00370G0001 [uncultured bacterium]
MKNQLKYFKNKKILVTGADGFIGSHLTEMLAGSGAKVKALSQYNSFNYWGWLEEINNKNIEVISGDIRDPHFCKKITRDIDIVFHLAALIAIPYSYSAPDSYVDTNIKGTLNICQGALENGCKKIIHTSTSEVYGSARYVPIDEKHPLQPQSPYSASKIGADSIALSFFYSFNLPLSIARPFNTYGPRQSARAVIPTIITQIASGQKEIKLGDISTTRDFNYVKDTCKGFLSIALSDKTKGEVINIGSGKETALKELIVIIKELMQSDVKIVSEKSRMRPENSEVTRLVCNNAKLISFTDFKSDFSLKEGLAETIKWFSNPKNLEKYKAHLYNV